MFISFRKLRSDDSTLTRVQDNVEAFLKQLENCPWLDGVEVKAVQLTSSSPNIINHKLGRAPQGYWITRQHDYPVIITDSQSTNPTPAATIVLNASNTGTVDLWIY